MIYPKYDFTDPDSVDWNAVLITVNMMFSDINNQYGCCKPKGVTEILEQVDGFLRDVQINTAGQPNANELRWQSSIQQAYLLLMGFFRLSADVSPIPVVPFPSDVISDIERGNAYFSNLQAEYSSDLKKGCYCMPTSYTCLKRIVSSLEYKVELEQYDDVSKGLVDKMIKIIGDFAPIPNVTIRWGYSTNVPNQATAVYQFSKTIPSGSTSYELDFSSAVFASDKYVFVEEDSNQPLKTKWVNDPAFNYGDIPDSLFITPSVVSGKRFYSTQEFFVAFSNNSKIKFSTT